MLGYAQLNLFLLSTVNITHRQIGVQFDARFLRRLLRLHQNEGHLLHRTRVVLFESREELFHYRYCLCLSLSFLNGWLYSRLCCAAVLVRDALACVLVEDGGRAISRLF